MQPQHTEEYRLYGIGDKGVQLCFVEQRQFASVAGKGALEQRAQSILQIIDVVGQSLDLRQ